MRYLNIILVLSLCSIGLSAGGNFFNLYSPVNNAYKGDFEFTMNHTFLGPLDDDPIDTFFGLDNGANIRIGLKYFVTDNLNLAVAHTRFGHRNSVLAGWSTELDNNYKIEFGAQAGLTNVKPSIVDDRENDFYTILTTSMWVFPYKVRPVINFAYDGYSEENGVALGLEVGVTPKFNIIGEFVPAKDSSLNSTYTIGGRYSTWSHQFLLGVTNTSAIGIQRQLPGTPLDDLHITLSIRRVL